MKSLPGRKDSAAWGPLVKATGIGNRGQQSFKAGNGALQELTATAAVAIW